MVCWGIPNHDDVTNFLRGQVLCSAMNFSQKLYLSLSGPCQPHRQICRRRSRGSPHPTTEWCWLKKSWLSYHRISPANTFCRHFLGPTGDLFVLIWQPCVEKSSLQIQRYVLLLARNMIQEKSCLCFYLYHTTCRNRILAEKTTRKMERERYCELIWCLWIGLIFRNNMHL